MVPARSLFQYVRAKRTDRVEWICLFSDGWKLSLIYNKILNFHEPENVSYHSKENSSSEADEHVQNCLMEEG